MGGIAARAQYSAPTETQTNDSTSVSSFNPVIDDIIQSYLPWTNVEFQGKLRTDKLPLQPTVKIYMVCDSLVQISVRVPLLGEVGRLNWTKDEILIVNKLKKTYVRESSQKFFEMYPTAMSDLQNIFLARVVILGSGSLSYENSSEVLIEPTGDGDWILMPDTGDKNIPFMYGYLISQNGRTAALTGATGKGSLEILYSYANGGMSMDCSVDTGKKTYNAELSFSSVKWGGSEMSIPGVGNYTKMSFKEFLKNLK